MTRNAVCLLLLSLLPLAAAAAPPAGELDTSFAGGNGFTLAPLATGLNPAAAVAETPEGGLLMVGVRENGCILLTQHTADGVPDDVFSGGMNFVVEQCGLLDDVVDGNYFLFDDLALAIAPDGDIYVAGTMDKSGVSPYVCRFLADGSRQGCVIGVRQTGLSARLRPTLLIRADQAHVVVNSDIGASPTLLRLDRQDLSLLSESTLLPDGHGLVQIQMRSADITDDGALVVAGTANFGAGRDFLIARFDLATDQVDTGFGDAGVLRLVFGGIANGFDGATAIRALPGGDVVVAGEIQKGNNRFAIGLARIEATGDLAASFNDGEPLTLMESDPGTFDVAAVDQTDSGKFVVAGALSGPGIEGSFAIRLLPDGAFDTEFSGNGIASFDIVDDAFDGACGMVLQGERIVLGGSAEVNSSFEYMLLRISDGRMFSDGFETP